MFPSHPAPPRIPTAERVRTPGRLAASLIAALVTVALLPPSASAQEDVDQCLTPDAEVTRIHQIQGPGAASPIEDQAVVTRGVVTADFTSGGESGVPADEGLRGFFIEAIPTDRDDDAQTSEGLFVFESAGTFSGEVGSLVYVEGIVGEYFGVTQVSASDVDVCTPTATLPPPAVLPLPMAPDDRAAAFEPLESMRVTHAELTVVEFFQLERFGEVRLSSGGVLQNPTNVVDPRDDEAYNAVVDFNAANTIILDDGRTGQNLERPEPEDPQPYVEPGDTLRIGDQLRDHPAILHFAFSAWRLQPIDIDAITQEFQEHRTRPRPEAPPEVGGSLTVASFNVLNYFNGEGYFVEDDPAGAQGFPTARGARTPTEFRRQTAKIVDAITRFDADVVALIEIENDEGERQAAAALVDALNDHLGEDVYDYIDTGMIGTDAIKLAYIYQPATVQPTGDYAILDSSVDPRFEDERNRPVLAQTFTELATGESVTVANNHLKSKGSPCEEEDNDPRQGNCNGVRLRAAQAMADWFAGDPTGQEATGTLIIGDLNAYAMEDPIEALREAGYTDLLARFSEEGTVPYTYTFSATQGYLDHALADEELLPFVTGAAAWNINADEVPVIDYQEEFERFRRPRTAQEYYQPIAFRSSDHDPVVVGLDLAPKPDAPSVTRLSGENRLETAVAISQDDYAAGAATTVILARADVYADALAGTPLAAMADGPLLLTPSNELHDVTREELERVLPRGATVHLLGGTAALDDGVESAVAAAGYEAVRIFGTTRIETSVEIARFMGEQDTLLITRAYEFPDALAAGAAAGSVGGAVLLTTDDAPHPSVDGYLTEADDDAAIFAVGGPAARAYPEAEPISGPTRFETAVAVAEELFDQPSAVGFARHDRFPDALAGGAHVARRGGPVLLTQTDSLHPSPQAYLCAQGALGEVFVYGGTAAITDQTLEIIRARAAGTGCVAEGT